MQKNSRAKMTTKVLANCALLAALSVVLARLIIPMPNASTRFSIEAVPIFLAGMLFGPLPGALVGFTADFVGCLFSGYGYNPIFCVPPILYGLCAGLLRYYLCAKPNLLRLSLGWLPSVVLGSVVYQSATLAMVYGSGVFIESFLAFLGSRSIQFAITMVLDVLIVFILCKTNIFKRMGLWPERKETT
jgi:ECF transporter S component (folate family)